MHSIAVDVCLKSIMLFSTILELEGVLQYICGLFKLVIS